MLWAQPATEKEPIAAKDKLTFISFDPVRSDVVIEFNGERISLIVRAADKFAAYLTYAKQQPFTVSFLEFIHGPANCNAAKLASALEEVLNGRE